MATPNSSLTLLDNAIVVALHCIIYFTLTIEYNSIRTFFFDNFTLKGNDVKVDISLLHTLENTSSHCKKLKDTVDL